MVLISKVGFLVFPKMNPKSDLSKMKQNSYRGYSFPYVYNKNCPEINKMLNNDSGIICLSMVGPLFEENEAPG